METAGKDTAAIEKAYTGRRILGMILSRQGLPILSHERLGILGL